MKQFLIISFFLASSFNEGGEKFQYFFKFYNTFGRLIFLWRKKEKELLSNLDKIEQFLIELLLCFILQWRTWTIPTLLQILQYFWRIDSRKKEKKLLSSLDEIKQFLIISFFLTSIKEASNFNTSSNFTILLEDWF